MNLIPKIYIINYILWFPVCVSFVFCVCVFMFLMLSQFSVFLLFFNLPIFFRERERERSCGVGWIRRKRGTGQRWGRGHCGQNILYEFSIKNN